MNDLKKYIIYFFIFAMLLSLSIIFLKKRKTNNKINDTNYQKNTIKIVYPSTNYAKLNKKIKEFITNQINDFAKITLNEEQTTYYLIINYKSYSYKTIISYIFFTETYFLGAHPIHKIWTINYDYKENKFITIDNIINNNQIILNNIANYTYQNLSQKKIFQNKTVLNMLKEGTKATLNNYKHILFSKEGIIIYFDRYQIAPYYYGNYNISIPYNILKSPH